MSVDSDTDQRILSSELLRAPISHAQNVDRVRRGGRDFLLNMSISKRLALGFLVPMLIVSLGLVNISLQSYRLLTNVSTLNQHLLHAYTSLTSASATLKLTQTNLQAALADADKTPPNPETLREDHQVVLGLVEKYDTTLNAYMQNDVLALSPDLTALFNVAGHGTQIDEQRARSNDVLRTWQSYQKSLMLIFDAIENGDVSNAQILEITQTESSYAEAMTSLLILLRFTDGLVPSIHDAMMVEENQLLWVMALSFLCLVAGLLVVGKLVSATVVRRLQRFQTVVQSIEQGLFSARVEEQGRDEIAQVSHAVNTTLDTIVGLLEETKQQRDELAKSEELKRLHEALQREHEALNAANARLEMLATTDVLTNLPNHRALQSLLEQECERTRRFGHDLSVLFFDGDRFKQVNDTYGHATGDMVLQELGSRTRGVLRMGDTVGRFGGEEFLVILPETNQQEAQVLAERLRSAVAALPLATSAVEGGIAITISIGVASYPHEGVTASELCEQADQAMYWAKRLGRNQIRTAAEAVRANRDADLKAATAHQLKRVEGGASDGHTREQQQRVEQLRLIYSLMGALNWREPGMSEHAHEVSDLVASMARILEFNEEHAFRTATAAFLHDIGKIALPDRLLHQPKEQFSAQEWQLLHQHAELGADIVEDIPWLSNLAPAIRHHHERWDGTGTPDGLVGTAIPLEARMIALAEAYHTMITTQSYQSARTPAQALAEIELLVGIQFDPSLLSVFRSALIQREHKVDFKMESLKRDMLSTL